MSCCRVLWSRPSRASGRGLAGLFFLPLLLLAGCRSGPKFTSESRIKQLGQLLTITVTQNGSVYPDISTPDALKSALQPVIASRSSEEEATFWREEIFIDAQSGKPFLPNARLSRVRFTTLDRAGAAGSTIALYAPQPTNGERLIVFADGHAAWMNESLWSPERLAVPGTDRNG